MGRLLSCTYASAGWLALNLCSYCWHLVPHERRSASSSPEAPALELTLLSTRQTELVADTGCSWPKNAGSLEIGAACDIGPTRDARGRHGKCLRERMAKQSRPLRRAKKQIRRAVTKNPIV